MAQVFGAGVYERGLAGHLCLNCTFDRVTGQFALTAEALSHFAKALWRRRGEGVQLADAALN